MFAVVVVEVDAVEPLGLWAPAKSAVDGAACRALSKRRRTGRGHHSPVARVKRDDNPCGMCVDDEYLVI